MTLRSLSIFRVVTVWMTLALVAFVMWISGGSMAGRFIAGGVLAFGLVQWLVLRRLSNQMAAKVVPPVDKDDPSR